MITADRVRELDRYSYLWDNGSDWVIRQCHSRYYRISIRFPDPDGPNAADLKRVRQWLPDFAAMTPGEARAKLGQEVVYVAGDFPGKTGEQLIKSGLKLGLDIVAEKHDAVHYEAEQLNGECGPVFEAEAEREYIIQKMRDAGRPVLMSEED